MADRPPYKKAALLYNPTSGQQRHLRLAKINAAAQALQAAGILTTLVPTEGPGTAGRQAVEAVAQGHDLIFACGGDGTIHDVLQGVVSGAPNVPIGIVPLGTGNVLAFDLGIPRNPASAIQKQLSFVPRKIAAGQIEFQTRSGSRDSRYFTLMAGVGTDALMLYRVHAGLKKRIGIFEYFRQAFRVVLAHPYEEFLLHLGSVNEKRSVAVSQFNAVRVANIGNRFRYFAMDSALERDDFHVVLVATANPVRTLQYFLRRFGRLTWRVPGIDDAMCTELYCEAKPGQQYAHGIYAQADGELLGGLPVTIRIVPNAFTLLVPPGR
ncbi:MAG TPA: diacylglycerol kinase family protein [Terriglobales bacterium]|nr:diacylglycerol kinase family protein [Terriglobales bacterium]